MQEIEKREVFYIAGYDPRGYRYYYSLYKKNAKKQNKINNLDIQVSKSKRVKEHIYSCDITNNKKTDTTYNFFAWNDIVKENWSEGFFANLWDTIYSVNIYIFSGVLKRFAKESSRQLIAGLYPLFYLLISLITISFLSYQSFFFLITYLNEILSLIISIFIFILGIKIAEKIGNNIAVFWLSRIYAFCARWSENKIKNIEQRSEYFAEFIFQRLKNNSEDKKEFILSSHSVGTILAINVANKVIKKCKNDNISYKHFKLLTLGHCVPLISYQKKAYDYKNILEEIGKIKDFTWIDYTASIDGACFPLIDPIKSSGIKKLNEHIPIMQSTRFFKLFKKENYIKIKKQKYKAHFLYLMATDLLGNYNYFDITAGSKALEFRIQNYMKEK